MDTIEIHEQAPLILIVDDSDEIRLQIRHFLARDNYRFAETANGEEALYCLLGHHPDVVILDVAMPIMDGITACRKIREIPAYEHIPILMVTAMDDSTSIDEAFSAGADEYISKPVHWALLRRRIKGLLEQKKRDTELASKTEGLETAIAKLKEVDHLKSMFIASMSHELRTPLNSVIGFSSIVLNEWIGPLNDEQKKSISSILRSGKHLLSLINDVIDVSKIEAGMGELNIDEFDLAELLKELEQTFAQEASDRGLFLTIQELHLPMFTDRRRLLQCLLNLVSNAIKFTEHGGATVTVYQDDIQGEASIVATVNDTGIGVSLADQPKLFKPFSRIQSPLSARVPGTGLGLYLTQKIVEDMLRGTVSMKSEPGGGSTFSLTIPCRVAE